MPADGASSSRPAARPQVGAVITDELATRPRRPLAPREEIHALQDLAWQMLERPDSFLPYLVETALRISDAHSAGISLHEPRSSDGDVFRWHYVSGACAPFSGRTTPRHTSPCGLCIDAGGPVLIAFPEQLCSDYAVPGLVSFEALLVPINLPGEGPLGALWVISHQEERRFDGIDARVLGELASFAGIALKMIRDAKALKEALEAQEILVREMRHRIGNVLTVASGIVSASVRSAATPQEMATKVRGRLEALGRAQALAHQPADDQPIGRGAITIADQLQALVGVIAAPYSDEGQRIALSAETAAPAHAPTFGQGGLTALGLVLHELATNAVKYGALSEPDGHVTVTWRIDNDTCVLNWSEQGGPAVPSSPGSVGFGSTLIKRTITGQLDGKVRFDWRPDGLHVEIRMACRALAR